MNKVHLQHLELLEVGAAFLSWCSHDIQEVWRQHEGNPLLTDSHETLVIPQDVTKVNVEKIPYRNTKEINLKFFLFLQNSMFHLYAVQQLGIC